MGRNVSMNINALGLPLNALQLDEHPEVKYNYKGMHGMAGSKWLSLNSFADSFQFHKIYHLWEEEKKKFFHSV